MKIKQLISLGLLTVDCTSCYTYKIYPKEYRKLENNNPKLTAYIVKDSLKKEHKIMMSSDLFEIISDSSQADLKIKLYPLQQNFVCGQPLTISILTIGQLPVTLPDRYLYRFDEIKNDTVTERKLELKLAQRVWFWDIFSFNKKFEEKAGKAVLGEYRATKNY
ncbi:hypothetical protein [Winogradskyella sp. A2]|uniref:hypothetical protein n=1 Tax=Winogradskyella sp. A2 TaxID=3366944 RepID=UPI00398C5EE8